MKKLWIVSFVLCLVLAFAAPVAAETYNYSIMPDQDLVLPAGQIFATSDATTILHSSSIAPYKDSQNRMNTVCTDAGFGLYQVCLQGSMATPGEYVYTVTYDFTEDGVDIEQTNTINVTVMDARPHSYAHTAVAGQEFDVQASDSFTKEVTELWHSYSVTPSVNGATTLIQPVNDRYQAVFMQGAIDTPGTYQYQINYNYDFRGRTFYWYDLFDLTIIPAGVTTPLKATAVSKQNISTYDPTEKITFEAKVENTENKTVTYNWYASDASGNTSGPSLGTNLKFTAPAISSQDMTKTFYYTFVADAGNGDVSKLVFSCKLLPMGQNPFTDVKENKFYFTPVLWAVENQITTGITATTFEPEAKCTRGQVVTFLWRAAGQPTATAGNPFKDVKSFSYCYEAVLWAVQNHITTGVTATTFEPDAKCTRGQVVTFLHRFAGEPVPTVGNPFADVSSTAFYYKAVLWAVQTHITAGMTTTTFEPEGDCTRGHVVTFLYRLYK